MIKVEAIKFGSSVNVANNEYTFIKTDRNSKCEIFFDADENLFILKEKAAPHQETVVFSTNVQWARLAKESNEPGEAKASRTRGPGTKTTP